MLKISQSHDCLIFNMGIPIPGKDGLYIESGPSTLSLYQEKLINVLRFEQNGHHFAKNNFQCIILNASFWISNKISLKCLPAGIIDDNAALISYQAFT